MPLMGVKPMFDVSCSRALARLLSNYSGKSVNKYRSDPCAARRMRYSAALLMGASFIAISAGTAFAATDTWTGGTSTSWSTGTNWSTGAKPNDNDAVVIGQTGTNGPGNFNINLTAASLTLNTAANTTASYTNGYSVANNGSSTFQLASGGFITDNAQNLAADHLDMGINLLGPATINLSSGATGLSIGGSGILGTGGLTVANASSNALLFLADNSYSGGTTISSGTLQLGNGGTSGSITGDVVDNGTLAFDRSDTITFSGAITGTGSLNQMGSGTLILTGTSSYSGGTTITAGTLQIGSGGTSGAIAGNVTDNGTLVFDRSDTVAFAGNISGTGAVQQIGSGKLTLSGANSYAGGTLISGGTLAVSADNSLGASTGSISITNGGTLDMTQGFTTSRAVSLGAGTENMVAEYNPNGSFYIFNGVVTGAGALNLSGTGTLVLAGDNTYGGGTTIGSGSTLSLGLTVTGSTTGSVTGNITDNGTLQFNHTNSITYGGVISGTGKVQTFETGTVILTGNNTYSGGTSVNAGTLQLGAGGTTGMVQGPITLVQASSTLVFDHSNSLTYSGQIGGAGTIETIGSGAVTLASTSLDTFSKLYIGTGSTLQLGNGTTGSFFDIGNTGTTATDNGALIIDLPSAGSLTLSESISGTGSLQQVTAGTTLTLTGNNTYSGGTTITAGTLQIGTGSTTGSITGNVTDNGTLAFNRSDNVSFNGAITGTGGVQQNGNGTLSLAGINSYSGVTAINSGTLSIFYPSNLGTGAVTMASNTTLSLPGFAYHFNNSLFLAAGTETIVASGGPSWDGVISGAGTLNVTQGLLFLTGTNTYTGGTTISNATLSIADASNIGTGGVTLTSGGTIEFTGGATIANSLSLGAGGGSISTGGNSVTWSGQIAGTGALTVKNGGTLILTSGESYSGGTTILSGTTLQLGNGSTAGAITGDVSDNGTLAFNNSNSASFAGIISGGGAVAQNGTGALTLSGANTYTGGTNVNAGTIIIGSDANLGNGGTLALAAGTTVSITATGTFTHNVTVTGDPTFSVAPNTTTTWSGLIADGSSAGTVEITGGGTFAPTNTANSYSGGTVVRGGSTLAVSADGEMGASSGGLTLGDNSSKGILDATASFTLGSGRAVSLGSGGGTIDAESGITFEIDQAITGTGRLTTGGAGTVILTGTSTYSGGTTIASGTLQLGNGATAGAITGNVIDNGALVFMEGADQTFNGVISGSGSVAQNDAGHTLTLTGADTYSGGTMITAGTLRLGDGTNAGTVTGNITDNGALIFSEGSNQSYNGVITGSGSVTQNDAGHTLTITGGQTYSGGTTIAAGTLRLGDGTTAGMVSGNITDNGALVFSEASNTTYGGAISGSGSVTQNDSGHSLTLTGANTYTGGTTISAGTLVVGDGTTNGSIQGAVTDNAALVFNRSDSITFSGVISGSGSLSQNGAGTLILTAMNTFTGGTTISSGTLQLGNGSTAGMVGNVVDNSALVFSEGSNQTYGGAVSGTGSLTQNDAGHTLTLTGSSTYTGATTITAGTLTIGNGGSLGGTSGVTDNGTLAFAQTGTTTMSAAVSGSGGLQQNGTGTTILTAGNTYAGGTTISAGILQIGNGSTGSISGNVTDNGTLAFGRSDAYTYAGVITGSGKVVQAGSGVVTLSGNSTYTGTTSVNAGVLLVTGNIGSSAVTVNNHGTLAGGGTVGSLNVLNGGTLTPGNGGVATLHVNGSLSLAAGSTYNVNVLSSSSHDLLSVSGLATLSGTVNAAVAGGTYTSPMAIISAAGGISGTLSLNQVSVGNEQGFLQYDAHDVYLMFMPTISSLVPNTTAKTNQGQVAAAIDFAVQRDNAGTTFLPVAQMPAANLPTILSQMAGEEAIGTQTAAVKSVTTFLGDMLDPSIGARGGLGDGSNDFALADRGNVRVAFNGPDSDMPTEHRSHRAVTIWSAFYGGRDIIGGDPATGTHKWSSTQYGGIMGLDYRPWSGTGALGVAIGVDGQKWDVAENNGTGNLTSLQAGVYFSRRFDHTYFSSAFSYSYHRVGVNRVIEASLFTGNASDLYGYHAKFYAQSLSGKTEVGQVFDIDQGQLTPFVRFEAQDLGLPDYSETVTAGGAAAAPFALTYTRLHHFDYNSELGLGWTTLLETHNDASTDAHLRLGWLHDYARGLTGAAQFSMFTGSNFTVYGVGMPKDAADVVMGIEHYSGNIALTLNAQGQFAAKGQSYGGNAALSYRW